MSGTGGSTASQPDVADIRWAAVQVGLVPDAFLGPEGDDPRQAVLKMLGDVDVPACPGSGKTTLLVAKLALLARDWSSRAQGICVISHTNVARVEIETRLGPTREGSRLLSHPHYVGTIHGFINQFLATPILRSRRMTPRLIDDGFANARRSAKLSFGNRAALEKAGVDLRKLRARNVACDLGEIPWGRGTLGSGSGLYTALQEAFRASMLEGYFRHEEMFLWAEHLLDTVPEVVSDIQRRFPILFVDEVQDNSEAQARLLHRLFRDGDRPSICQRFGDMNQAIFNLGEESSEAALTDPFPRPGCQLPLPNSHRFDQSIADLAAPLAPTPLGLVGLRGATKPREHAVFLFDDDATANVLPAFARRLLAVLPAPLLHTGRFTAIGHVHRPRADGAHRLCVADYLPGYNHEMLGAEPRPKRFLQYLRTPRGERGDVRTVVDRMAEALLHLVRTTYPTARPLVRQRRHIGVLEALTPHPEAKKLYLKMVEAVAAGRPPRDEAAWLGRWVPRLSALAALIANDEPLDPGEFLEWIDGCAPMNGAPPVNSYRHAYSDGAIDIEVGSIHAAKGETHTATLVLETFFRKHHLCRLMPWLVGVRRGGTAASSQIVDSLKQHYVAMTRPTDLLCLAIRRQDVSALDVAGLKGRGWNVVHVTTNADTWL